MSSVAAAVSLSARSIRTRLSWTEELVTNLLALWTLVGVFLDGWAHSKYDIIDTFFTPWHAVFYSGFFAMVGWVLWERCQAILGTGRDIR